jgi:cobalamin biosynthesis protein CobT
VQRPQALGLIALLVLMSPRASALQAQEDSNRQPGAGTPSTPPTQAEQEAARKRAQEEQEAARRRAEAELRAAEERARAEMERKKREAEEARSRAEKRKGEEEEAREKVEKLKQDAEEARARAEKQQEEAEEARARAEKQREEAEEEAERAEAEKDKKPAGPEPELNLPIRYFVYTAVLSGLGYATGFLSAGPERDLRNTAKHRTPDETLSLYRRARYGGLLSKGFYSLSGAVGGYAAYKTQSAVREYLSAKAKLAMQQQQQQARRPTGDSSEQDRLAAEVTRALLVPPLPDSTEIVLPEPPPIQAGIFLGPSGDTSFSLSVRF